MLEVVSPPIQPKTAPNLTTPEKQFPRGISVQSLIQQIWNTAPYLHEIPLNGPFQKGSRVFLETLVKTRSNLEDTENLSHEDYFFLCLCAHHATVGTPVPTDVDNQIRYKLWAPGLPLETVVKMSEMVKDSLSWDYGAVSERVGTSPISQECVDGHHGEWLSTAVAAYGATRKKSPDHSKSMLNLIIGEVDRERQILLDCFQASQGIELLKSIAMVVHNLGDLDRVIDLWNLSQEDPLRLAVYKLGHSEENKSPKDPIFWSAGEVYKTFLASENHRHFALREPRPLRKSRDFLTPVAPFYDDWGKKIGVHPGLSPEEIAEIAESLIDGWQRLGAGAKGAPVAYARGLRGITQGLRGGISRLVTLLPAKKGRMIQSGQLHAQMSIDQNRFEESIHKLALQQFSKLNPQVRWTRK